MAGASVCLSWTAAVVLSMFSNTAFAQLTQFPFAITQDNLSGPVDFSFLNRPITDADRIFVREGHFFRVGADLKPFTQDDERVRFFGVNLAFGANFPEERDADRIATRLQRLGVNLVRLHHMDSRPDSDPRVANSILMDGPYPTLNPVSVARLRRFISALRQAGIYIDLNLHVGYEFRPAVDGVKPLVDGKQMPRHGKPLYIFDERMIALQEEYSRQLIVALGLIKNPVLALVEINNESSLVHAWQIRQLPGDIDGEYLTELKQGWLVYRREHMDSLDADLISESLKEHEGYLGYLIDMDRRYLDRLKRVVQEVAGALVPVTGTQMNFGGLPNVDSHVNMDFIDSHLYVDHYYYPNRKLDHHDWRINNLSIADGGLLKLLNGAFLRVHGKPYTVTEFNQPWPNTHGAEINPVIAMFGAFQDWDALVFFAYAHRRDWDAGLPNGFNLNGDIAKLVNFGQSAWMFRTGVVSKGRAPFRIVLNAKDRARTAIERISAWQTYRFFGREFNVSPLLSLRHPLALADGPTSIPNVSVLDRIVDADTNELAYDKIGKRILLKSALAAGVMGQIQIGERAIANAVMVEAENADVQHLAVLVTALDGWPLAQSSRLLLTVPGPVMRTRSDTKELRLEKLVDYPGAPGSITLEPNNIGAKPSGSLVGGTTPAWMTPSPIVITLTSQAQSLIVYPLDGSGRRLTPLSKTDVEKIVGGFRIRVHITGQVLSPWYEMVAG